MANQIPGINFNTQAFAQAFAPLMMQGVIPPLNNQPANQPTTPVAPQPKPVVVQPQVNPQPQQPIVPPVAPINPQPVTATPANPQPQDDSTPAKRYSIPGVFQHLADFPRWVQGDFISKLAKKELTLVQFMETDPSQYKKPTTNKPDSSKKSQAAETSAQQTPPVDPQPQPAPVAPANPQPQDDSTTTSQQPDNTTKPAKKPRKQAPEVNSGPKPFNAANFVVNGAPQPVPAPVTPKPQMVGPAGTPYIGLTHGSVWTPQQLYPGYGYPDGWSSFKRQQKSEYIADLFKQDGVIQAPDPTPGLGDTARLNELAGTIAFQNGVKTLGNLSHEEILSLQRMLRSNIINTALQQSGYKYPESGFAYFMEAPKRWYTNDQQELQFYDWAFEVGLNDQEGNKTDNCLVVLWKVTPDYVAESNGWVDQHVVFPATKVQPKNA